MTEPAKGHAATGARRCLTLPQHFGAKDTWNHPAFFDYVDRWMTEDDTQAVADIKTQSGFDYSSTWERQGQTASWLQGEFPQYSFVDDMWKAYRN